MVLVLIRDRVICGNKTAQKLAEYFMSQEGVFFVEFFEIGADGRYRDPSGNSVDNYRGPMRAMKKGMLLDYFNPQLVYDINFEFENPAKEAYVVEALDAEGIKFRVSKSSVAKREMN